MARSTTTLMPWYGSNRENAAEPAKLLEGCDHVTVSFAGGLSELPHFTARTLLVNDIHRHAMNLASVFGNKLLRPDFLREVKAKLFHPDSLSAAQWFCKQCTPSTLNDLDAAINYFVAVWMGRSAAAGTKSEFNGNLSIRYNSGGGDSAVRYRSAIRSALAFVPALERSTFSTFDVFDLYAELLKRPPRPGETPGVYADAPWPDDGKNYKHGFTEEQQGLLAQWHVKLAAAGFRVVVRYGDHPLIRSLYPESHFEWRELTGRTQANKAKNEVLLLAKYPEV